MGRTQVYLSDEDLAVLDRVAAATGASRSELIRRAVRQAYAQYVRHTPEERLALLGQAAGSWRDREETGAEYVERTRQPGDFNLRLRKLGID